MVKTKVLLFHNILWSHYKAAVFSELNSLLIHEGIALKVVHAALTEKQRKGLGEPDRSLHKYSFKVLFEKTFEETKAILRFYFYLLELLKIRPKVVILPGYSDLAIVMLIPLLKIFRVKVIQTVDSNWYDKPREKWLESLKSIILSHADLIYCYGSMQVEYLRSLNVPPEKICIRYQATDNRLYLEEMSRYQDVKREKILLYVGRISPEKNLEFLIETFHDLNTDWVLKLVGTGPSFKLLESKIAKEGIRNVHLEGGKTWKEVIQYYAYGSIFVLPSISEPWGLVVNEAMLCSLPVLVSSHCGCSKDLVTEGKNGLIFNPTNKTDLKNKLRIMLNSDELESYGAESFSIIQLYTPQKSAEQMLSGLKKFMN